MRYQNYNNGGNYFWLGMLVFFAFGGFRTIFLLVGMVFSLFPFFLFLGVIVWVLRRIARNSQIGGSIHGFGVSHNQFVELFVRISIQAIKADGHVDQRELDSLKSFFRQQLRYQGHQMEWVEDLIQTSLKQSYSLVDLCEEFQQRFSGEPCYVLLDMVYRIISIDNVIDKNIKPFKDENLNLNKKEKKVISFWAKFIENFPNKSKFPSFPIWSHEWGADYPYIDSTPYATLKKNLIGLKGTHGFDIPNNISKDSILLNYIPRYSQLKINRFPEWKIKFIKHNRDFYQDYKDFIDDFLNKNSYFYDFDFSNQKFEWNCKGEELTLNNKLIQFRPSGLRVKKSNWSPAITTVKSQNIFYPKIGRQLSLRETLKLQSLELDFLPDIHNGKFISNGGYKAIGNSVNVKVVKLIGEKLLIKNNG